MSLLDIFRVSRRIAAAEIVSSSLTPRIVLIASLHVTALAVMAVTETTTFEKLLFLLTWGILNGLWLTLLRRPLVSAALSLAMVCTLIAVSQFKHHIIWMTANFLDVLIIDHDTLTFFLTIYPGASKLAAAALALALLVCVLLWRIDPFRVRRLVAAGGAVACLAVLSLLALANPNENWEVFINHDYVSKFSRSGVESLYELARHGWLESDATASDRLAPDVACTPTVALPHIILVHDESSFDVRHAPGIKVPPGYGDQFVSFDGKERNFVVETNGGASWNTEYNVLFGLSARSFGGFSYLLPRIAAGHIERGLPRSLAHCGYRTFSFYPSRGEFMNARSFETSAGIQNFYDSTALGTQDVERDGFYYNAAARMLEGAGQQGPTFSYVYLAANHFPWTGRWHPELTPQWHDLGNEPEVDEYLRRQGQSARDYADFIATLKSRFPAEKFLIVRYGDHLPSFGSHILEPSLDEDGIAARLAAWDLRHFTTYYSIDTINYRPAVMPEAFDTLHSAYLPLAIQEIVGLPLDSSFAEQKRIFERCHGVFYACNNGAEARRFNRMLIDAGEIKGL